MNGKNVDREGTKEGALKKGICNNIYQNLF